MGKRGRKPTLLPPGVRRRELKRHEIRIWLKDAPDDPPTIVIQKTKSIRPVGRPRMSPDRAKAMIGLRIPTAINVTRQAQQAFEQSVSAQFSIFVTTGSHQLRIPRVTADPTAAWTQEG